MMDYVKAKCINQSQCTLVYSDLPDPCDHVVKKMVAQLKCSTSAGGVSGPPIPAVSTVFALGANSPDGSVHKVLLGSAVNEEQSVALSSVFPKGVNATQYRLYLVDEDSVQQGSPTGIRTLKVPLNTPFTLLPFAVAVAVAE